MQERRKDLADKLENGLKELYASEKYTDYLKTMSKFPRYSSRNVMLIHMQMPGASRVAGASKWKSDFKRHPKKGEKAIYIYAPVKNDKEPETKMMEKIDPETGAPMLDKNGKVIVEEMTALDMSRMRYRPAPVFDVSQTDGKPLPEIVSPLNGDVERYEALLDALKAVSTLPIEFEKISESQDGYCRFGEKIGIREGMSERQTVAAILHEIAHSRMHDKDSIPEDEAKKSRAVRELEAESVAFAISEKYGVDTGANSFGYLSSWAGHDPEMKQLKASLDIIQKEVGSLSRELDVHYAAALKNRGLEAEQPQEREGEMKVANAKGIDAICAKARKYITENGLFLAFSVNDIKDYQSLRRAAQDVEARNSAHPTAGQNHIKFMYDLLRQAEPFQNVPSLTEQEKVSHGIGEETSEPPLKQEPRDSMLWSQGEVTCPVSGEKYKYWVKHFDTGSHYGIDGGCISKLTIRKVGEYKNLCNFDRGWDVQPTREVKEVYAILLQTYNLPKEKEIAAVQPEQTVSDTQSEKEYSLGFGYSGSVNSPDGMEVWNWLDEKPDGGYTIVANISSGREVTFIDENMPDSVKNEIYDKANTAIMQEEEQSECRFIPAANLPDGWRWQQWDDGSGSLQSPDDKSVVSYDLSTSEYKYKGKWNFMAGYPNETESFSSFKDSMEKRVCIDRGIDVAALSAETAEMSQQQEKSESPMLGIDDYVVTGADAIISGHGRITGLASDDYPGSNEQFIVDFGSAGTCTVHKDDMAAEIVSGYKIMQRIEISDKEGVALAHSPTAPDPYVTWRYIERGGERDYQSGQYRQSEESALNELYQRADTVRPNLNAPPPEAEAPAPEPTMSTFPLYKGNLSDAVEYGETETYHQSRQLNFQCRDTIDKTIEEHRKPIPDAPAGVCTYDMKAAVWSVIGECGRERAEWVLAANINGASYDGRFSRENKEWAKNTGAPERHDYHIQSHKAVLDGFARRFRESEKEKPPMSFLYTQAQQRKKDAEAQKSGGDIEQSGHKKSEER